MSNPVGVSFLPLAFILTSIKSPRFRQLLATWAQAARVLLIASYLILIWATVGLSLQNKSAWLQMDNEFRKLETLEEPAGVSRETVDAGQ